MMKKNCNGNNYYAELRRKKYVLRKIGKKAMEHKSGKPDNRTTGKPDNRKAGQPESRQKTVGIVRGDIIVVCDVARCLSACARGVPFFSRVRTRETRWDSSRRSTRPYNPAIANLFLAFRISGFLAFWKRSVWFSGFLAFWFSGVCATIALGQNTRSFYNDPFGGEYFVEASVDKSTAYVNEQITYILSYYYTTISPALESPKYKLPDSAGFWKKKLPHPEPYWKNIRGARYRVEERKIALFPISSGTIDIKPARVDIPRASYLDETRMLTSESIELKILPLSEIGKPVGFQGVVGNYTLTARADKDTIEVGQPITLTVSIVGSGNINALPEPEIPELTAFTRYGPKMSVNTTTETDQIQGKKIYEYIFVPTSAGQWQIPSIQMSYFAPNREIYYIARAEPIDIRVIPGATTVNVEAPVPTNVQILGQDIRHIKSADANLRDQSRYLYQRFYFWALQLLPLCAIAAAILYKRCRTIKGKGAKGLEG